MSALKIYRPSALPLVAVCTQASDVAQVPVGANAAAQAAIGNCYHAIMEDAIPKNERPSKDTILHYCAIYDVKYKDVSHLVWKGWSWWLQVLTLYPNPKTEQSWAHGQLKGTADLFSHLTPKIGHGGDWKSGFREFDSTHQASGYIWLAFQEFPELEEIHWLIIKIRDLRVDPVRKTRQEAEQWYSDFMERAKEGKYVVNTNCSLCTRILDCPAVRGWIRLAATTLDHLASEVAGNPDALPDGEALWTALETSKLLKGVADRFDTAAREALKVLGPQKLPRGLQLNVYNNSRAELLGDLVSELLLEYGVKPEQQIKALSFTKTDLDPLISDIAHARGATIKSVKQEFYNRLDRMGGIINHDSWKMTLETEMEKPKKLKP